MSPQGNGTELPWCTCKMRISLLILLLCGCMPNTTIYLNFDGGEFAPGDRDDSRLNTSTVLRDVVELPHYAIKLRLEVEDCVRDKFADYHVEVVTSEPAGDHLEVAVTSDGAGVLPEGKAGLAPIALSCQPLMSGIAFVAAEPSRACDLVAHEIGHLMTLSHTVDCSDIMSDAICGKKQFLPREIACGENGTESACICGGDTQNSDAILTTIFGAR